MRRNQLVIDAAALRKSRAYYRGLRDGGSKPAEGAVSMRLPPASAPRGPKERRRPETGVTVRIDG
jgi:hypothetical protein